MKGASIQLLKIVKKYSLNYLANKYDMIIILDALRNFINLWQKNKSLYNYKFVLSLYKRFWNPDGRFFNYY